MAELYLVPTPIGNLEDLTHRAERILRSVDFILAEDTRTSKKLLNHYEISKPLLSYHMHNEHKSIVPLIGKIQSGQSAALISDAGTPGISDPGFLLVRACIEAGIRVECLPGPTAFVPALVQSGLPCERFVFEGFLPVKKGRKTRLELLKTEVRTIIFYESPHKIIKTLTDLAAVFGPNRQASISRELSKKFEETLRGTLAELSTHFQNQPPKGEMVLVVKGAEQQR